MNLPRKALSIRQPWAWAILHAGKDVENRDWSTRFRGPVCIHAAKGMTRDEYENFKLWAFQQFAISAPDRRALYRGGIVGTAEIVNCVYDSDSPWFFGPCGFVVKNARPVEFIPVRGSLGFFDWRAALIGEGGE